MPFRDVFAHMFTEHHFNMGHPDNLVFLSQLLHTLETSLDWYSHLFVASLERHLTAKLLISFWQPAMHLL